MLVIALFPLVAFVAGCLVYALASNAKVAEIGRAALWCGLLVLLSVMAHQVVRVG